MQRRILWCDAEANCSRLNNRQAVAELADRARQASIDTLIVDVKPLCGQTLYNSSLAPRLVDVRGDRYPDSFDLLQMMIEEGHRNGIDIHAGINVFCEGHRLQGRGPAFANPDWQVTSLEGVRYVEIERNGPIRVGLVDPWEQDDQRSIYTRRTGKTIKTSAGMLYAVIDDETVQSLASSDGIEIPVPADGCVLVIPATEDNGGIREGSAVNWSVEHVLRRCEDSMIPSWGIFVNPIGSARDYELSIIGEIVSGYDIDGIVFDRMRYPNLYADFSGESLDAFGRWLGNNAPILPGDIFSINNKPWLPVVGGKFFMQWLEWRAWQIRDFAEEAVRLVRSHGREIECGVYVGSWYESYYDVGVNWASRDFHPGYEWMTPGYNATGYAELFDYICTGCYYPMVSKEDARRAGQPEGATVEAGCEMSRQAIGDSSSTYGSIYLRDYKGNPDDFTRGIEMVGDKTDGIMLFDLVYLYDYDWWTVLEDAMQHR